MAKEIDLKKLLESLIKNRSEGKTMAVVIANLVEAIQSQGFSVDDNGEIVSIEPENEQVEPFAFEKGKWYVCIRTSYRPNGEDFIEGRVYYAKDDYKMLGECGEVDIATDNSGEFFRPATKEEIPQDSQRMLSGEAKQAILPERLSELESGKWYVYTSDNASEHGLTKGKAYLAVNIQGLGVTIENDYGTPLAINGFLQYLRPAKEEEISEAEYARQDKGIEKALRESYKAMKEESKHEPSDGELTEFEKSVRDIITSELCNNFGDVSFGVSISDEEAKLIAKKILPVARREIIKSIDTEAMVEVIKKTIEDNPLGIMASLSIPGAYRMGIEDAKNIIATKG